MTTAVTELLIQKYMPILRESPLFRQLSDEELHLFLNNTSLYIELYKKQSFIALTGEPMEGIGILLSGHAHLTRENVMGQRTIMTELHPSDMFGEALLFTDKPNWPATIQTTKASEVLFLPLKAFTGSFKGCESCQLQIVTNLLHDMSEKALQLTRKVHYLSLKGMREKIFAYFMDIYNKQHSTTLQLPHNRQEMADVLNVSRTALSRELGRLQDEGIIRLDGKTVSLLNLDDIAEFGF